jgi:penicillin-binding protein 1A
MRKNSKKQGKDKTGSVAGNIFKWFFGVLLTLMLVGVLAGIIVVSAFAIYVNNYIDPVIDPSLLISSSSSQTTKIYYFDYEDRQNRIGTAVELEDQRLYGEENNIWVSINDVPQDLIDAFVSVEDHRFWDHSGVDWIRTCGAVLNFFSSSNSYGGSTITQQLIKNLTGNRDYTIQRKVQEILCALNLEKTKSKNEILEMYLNIVPLSQNCVGVSTAAYTYFGKDVKDLTLVECAALARITQRPTYYDPIQNPENNKEGRQVVLDLMLKFGKITKAEYDEAYDADLVLNVHSQSGTVSTNSWYTDTVIDDVINDLVAKGYNRQIASNMVYYSGLQIYTVMDPEVQAVLEEVYEDDSNFPVDNKGVPAKSSMVVVDPYTGDLLGIVGGRGEKESNRIFNYATHAKRSPGSTIKPISVYAPALEEGLITYGSVYDDVPVSFGTNPENPIPWPGNAPYVYRGLTTINSAVERSVNTIAVKVLQKLGLEVSFDYVKNRLMIDSLIERGTTSDGLGYTDMGLAALALGQLNLGLTVREITAAYATFPNGGVCSECRSYLYVLDSEGNVILENNYRANIVFSEQTAYVMTNMLQNVVDNGTARGVTLKKTIDVAGKTGTAGDDYDRWFIGYTPYYVGGVWYGFEFPKSLSYLSTNPCITIWDKVMTKLHAKYIEEAENGGEPLKTFDMPDGIVTATYCQDSGKLLTDACRADPRGSRADTGVFVSGTEPKEYCDVHVLVDYDSVLGGIAHEYTPESHITKVGLIKVEDRSFPIQIVVTDAQYVWRELRDGVVPGSYWSVPFFVNMLRSGEYCGISNSSTSRQYNAFAYENYFID